VKLASFLYQQQTLGKIFKKFR